MGENIPSTFENGLKIRRGVPKFAIKNADGSYQAYVDLAPSSALTYGQESEKVTYISKMSGIGKKLDETQTALNRDWTLTCEGLKKSVLALVVAGTLSTIAQASGSVTDERTGYVIKNGTFQLGGALNSGAGVFDISAVTVSSYEGLNADDRANSTAYAVGDIYVPAVANSHWYICTVAGTSAGSAPTFTTNGTTFADGTATFKDMGVIQYTVATDYELNVDTGLVFVLNTGAIAAAIDAIVAVPALVTALTDSEGNFKAFTLNVAYTRAAVSFDQIAATSKSQKEGKFLFLTQNPKGDDEVWYCPSVTLSPSGEADLLGDEYAAFDFAISVQDPATGAAIYINNVPA
jgi:hypothetical protein